MNFLPSKCELNEFRNKLTVFLKKKKISASDAASVKNIHFFLGLVHVHG